MRFSKKSILCLLLATYVPTLVRGRPLPPNVSAAEDLIKSETSQEPYPGLWKREAIKHDLLSRSPDDKDKNDSGGSDTSTPDPSADPTDDDIDGIDPGAGLDPTRPDVLNPESSLDPGAGLDPTRPDITKSDVAAEPTAEPTKASTPASTASPTDAAQADDTPICKRADDGRCTSDGRPITPELIEAAGPSGDGAPDAGGIGDEPEQNTPAEVAAQRRVSADDSNGINYITEQVEIPNEPSNRFLARLNDRINKDVADPVIRDSDFDLYGQDRKDVADIFSNDVNTTPGHKEFSDMFTEMGVKLDNKAGGVTWLHDPDFGGKTFDQATQRWSYSSDSKSIFADFSFNDYDIAQRQPFTNKAAYMLGKEGVDLKKVEAIGRVNIQNDSTVKTIQTAYDRLPHVGPGGKYVRIRADSDNLEEQKAFDGLLRTANGRSAVNVLAYFHQAFGDKTVAEILCQPKVVDAAGKTTQQPNMLITLKNAK